MTKKKPNYPSAGQGVLAGLEAPEALRHPMFDKPHDHEDSLPPAVRALRSAIRRSVTPFDGRSDMEAILLYCESIWAEGEGIAASWTHGNNPSWLIGQIHWITAQRVATCDRWLAMRPVTYQAIERDKKTMRRLAQDYTDAITKAVLPE